MTFDNFIKKYTGVPVDFDGYYGTQCMDLMHQYIYDVLGLKDKSFLAQAYAYLVFTNYNNVSGHELFEKIDNTPEGVPQKGDIIFFDKNVSGVTGVAGHVSIFVSGDINSFESFDANYPTGTLPHIQKHTYKGVLGWLKPTTAPAVGQTALDACLQQHQELVNKLNAIDGFRIAISKTLINSEGADWQRILDEVNKLINEHDEAQKQANLADRLWDGLQLETGVNAIKYTNESEKELLTALGGLKTIVPDGYTQIKITELEQLKSRKTLDKFDIQELIKEVLRRIFKK